MAEGSNARADNADPADRATWHRVCHGPGYRLSKAVASPGFADFPVASDCQVVRASLSPESLAAYVQEHADRQGILAGQHEAQATAFDAQADQARIKQHEHLKVAEAYATAAHHLRNAG